MALRVVQAGAIAVVLAATALTAFDLDRFFVPKELVLHVTALLAGVLTLRAVRRVATGRVESLLMVYLLVSATSALFATNPWLAVRAVAVSASGVVLYFAARALRDAGLARPLLDALALAVVVAAVTALAHAYGLRLDVFATTRAPGGTLGNRNFVAHAAAFGFPIVLLAALRAPRGKRYFFAAAGVAIVIAALVLTRSRAAWLAFGAVVIVFGASMIVSGALRRDGTTWRRLLGLLLFAGAGVAAALLLPNALRWRSDNPYLESMKDVANYQEGSGHGRLVQYERSLRMAAHHPLLGVGPGNWAVVYPANVPRHDPSLDQSEGGMTSNPWPSSDWIAAVSERGLAAAVLMAIVFALLLLGGFRRLRRAIDADEALPAAALVATVAAAGIAGTFDAVLLLALPTLLVWTAIGALWIPDSPRSHARPLLVLLIIAASAVGVVRSASQLITMNTYVTRSNRASLEWAARLDPGNYRLQLRLAHAGTRAQRCAHALAAHALFPSADAARAATAGCAGPQGVRRRLRGG